MKHQVFCRGCTACACGNFHNESICGHVTRIGCPKLDEGNYAEKLTQIIAGNGIKSMTVRVFFSTQQRSRKYEPCITAKGVFAAKTAAEPKPQRFGSAVAQLVSAVKENCTSFHWPSCST